MIISHKYKFIFFAIPKTGTHAIRFALRPFLGNEDEEHVGLFHQSKLKIGNFRDRKNGHISVKEIRPWFSEDQWNSYYKFTFIRNPLDRFISACFFKYPFLQQEPNLQKCRAWLKVILEREQRKNGTIFRPQLDYITDREGKIPLDFIGKYDRLNENFAIICNHLNIPPTQLKKINNTNHNEASLYFDKELEGRVSLFYQQDLAYYLQ